MSGQVVTLSHENAYSLVKMYLNQGIKVKGGMSVQDGATLNRYFRVVLKQEEGQQSHETEENIYRVFSQLLDKYASEGAYSTDDLENIHKVKEYLINESQKNKEDVTEASSSSSDKGKKNNQSATEIINGLANK